MFIHVFHGSATTYLNNIVAFLFNIALFNEMLHLFVFLNRTEACITTVF